MLLPHAQTLAQARSYVAALADRALTLDASSAYERVLLDLESARDQATTRPASSPEFTTPSLNSVVEHWRLAARAAALAEHDTAPDQAIHLTAAQARTIAGDVAAISQALVVLDRRVS